MDKIFFTLASILLLLVQGFSQNLTIPFANAPQVDGVFSISEWQGADSISITINTSMSTKVLFKHDNNALYAVFLGNLQSGGNYFPEIVIDTQNDGANSFQSDDWWFHVSATDCEFQGQYGNYANCQLVRPNWTALPNFSMSGGATDTIEIEIPFSTLGINSQDTIGVTFLLNNFMNLKKYPASSNHLNPSTWLVSTFDQTTGIGKEEKNMTEMKLFPNPVENLLSVAISSEKSQDYHLILQDMKGSQVVVTQFNNVMGIHQEQVNLSGVAPGLYFLSLQSEREVINKKLVVK